MVVLFLLLFGLNVGPVGTQFPDCPNCEVELVTMFPGDELFTGFGHIAFRLRNLDTGEDEVFDYGTYDAQDPMIGWHFLTGQLKYYCSHTTWDRMLQWYSSDFGGIESRKLELSAAQVDQLVRRVRYDCLPENSAYPYHHFYNNCSTKIRDILDLVLQGQLTAQMKGKPAKRSLRDLIDASMHRPAFAASRWVVYGLLNGTIDRTADRWDQAFLPYYLTAELDALVLPGGRPLVKGRETASGAAQGEPPDPSMLPGALVLACLVLMGLLPWLLTRLVSVRSGRIVGGVWVAFCGLLLGFYGVVLVFSWAVSPYPETKWNWTVACIHPLHLVLVALGAGIVAGRRWALYWLQRYLVCFCLLSAVLAAASVTGLLPQRIWHYGLMGVSLSAPLVAWLAWGKRVMSQPNGEA